MVTPLPNQILSDGESVEAILVLGPDLEWAERVERLLQHKGEIWEWQNCELLRKSTGAAARFFLLHRAGVPFSHLMLVEVEGVGLLGHVWTEAADRRKTASAQLMNLMWADFTARGGRALFLGAGFETPAWSYYQRRGFEPIEPGSGYMQRFAKSRGEFDATWFGAANTVVEPLDWAHWPAASPLLLADFPGVVRIAATQLIGRISEGPLLPLIRASRSERASGSPPTAWALRDAASAAVLGLASRSIHPLWPDTDIIDVFCHPKWWHCASALLQALPISGRRCVSYCDTTHDAKRRVLRAAGFSEQTVLPRWVFSNARKDRRVDVTIFSR